jgi:hypothetical protein
MTSIRSYSVQLKLQLFLIYCFLFTYRKELVMQFQRNCMRNRVAKRFARIPGQHGDGNFPMYYPMPINPGVWGTPWGKVKDDYWKCFFTGFVAMPVMFYLLERQYHHYRLRVALVGKRAWWAQKLLRFNDMDDPDYEIKWAALMGEYKRGETVVTWGGTNLIGSWLWEPGDPEPDKRRRAAPVGAH